MWSILESVCTELSSSNLTLVVSSTLSLTLSLELVDDLSVCPTELRGETLESAELTAWLETQNTESLWDDHLLLVLVEWWNTLENLKTLHGSSTSSDLVWDHTTDSLQEDTGWSSVVEWTTLGWLDQVTKTHELHVLELSSEEGARQVELLTSDDDDTVTVEKVLCNDASESSWEG